MTGAGFARADGGLEKGTGRLTRDRIIANNRMIRTADKLVEAHASRRLKKAMGSGSISSSMGKSLE